MPELPSPEWTVDQYQEWLRYAFEALENAWPDEASTGKYPWDDVGRRNFVEILDITEAQVETTPALYVLKLFLRHVDERFSDDSARREALLDPGQQRSILDTYVRQAAKEQPAAGAAQKFAPAPVAPPPPSVETFYWVTPEQAKALGNDWQNILRNKLNKTYDGWQRNTDPKNLVQWITMYWTNILSELPTNAKPPVAPPPPPRSVETLYWVTPEQAKALGNDWQNVLRRKLNDVYPGWQRNTDPKVLVDYVRQYWPVFAAAAKPQPAATAKPAAAPAKAAAQQAAKAVSDVAQAIRAKKEDLAGSVSTEVFQQVVAEVLAERVAARR
jgi:hypothetical protein